MSRRQKIILSLALIGLFHFLLVIVFGDNGLVELNRKRERRDRLVEVNQRLTEENYRLFRSIERLKEDPAYIESIARRELGMIAPDEMIFKVRPKRKAKNK